MKNKGVVKKFFIDAKKHVPKRFIIFIIVIALSVYFYKEYLKNLKFTENQYFWILGSYIQGFAAFAGIIIASVSFFLTNRSFIKKSKIKRLGIIFYMSITTSLITIFFSILGIVLYYLINRFNSLGFIILITSLVAIWSIAEIFNVIIKLTNY